MTFAFIIKFGVWYQIFSRLDTGLLLLFVSIQDGPGSGKYDRNFGMAKALGISFLLLGVLLLYGFLRKNLKSLFAFLIITTITLTLSTGGTCYTMVKKNESPDMILGIPVILIEWMTQFFLYLYYKGLKRKKYLVD